MSVDPKRWIKLALLLTAMAIGVLTLWFTENLASELREDARQRVAIWAQAMQEIGSSDVNANLNLHVSVISQNQSIPIILADSTGQVLEHRNLAERPWTEAQLQSELEDMAAYADPIHISIEGLPDQYVYQGESILLRRLRLYPRFLLGIIASYILLSYVMFSRLRKAEQDRVWTGMARETAHQIGTPLSALYGWAELLEAEGVAASAIVEIRRDLDRLQTVSDRFSKIGSDEGYDAFEVSELIQGLVEYLSKRLSRQIALEYQCDEGLPSVRMQPVLVSWVLENIIRNAIDAMEGKEGMVNISCIQRDDWVQIQIQDSGKGMTSSTKRRVFQPGFTTKTRGWGLGLSLAKRIIEKNHHGRLYVAKSAPGEGTTFCIELPMANPS